MQNGFLEYSNERINMLFITEDEVMITEKNNFDFYNYTNSNELETISSSKSTDASMSKNSQFEFSLNQTSHYIGVIIGSLSN